MPYIPPGTGPFNRSFAYARGFTESDVRTAVRRKQWIRLRRDVFVTAEDRAAAGDGPTRHAQDVQALLLRLWRIHIAAAGTSAARIYDWEFLRQPRPGLIVCTDDPDVSGTHKRDYFLRVAPLPASHFQLYRGVPITSPARTLLDLASVMPFTDAVVLADSALRKRFLTLRDLGQILDETDNRPGIQAARKALTFADPLAESVLESESRASMLLGGIRIPESQKVVIIDGEEFRIDHYWDHLPVDVYGEADGTEKYIGLDRMTTVRKLREEKYREQKLIESGAEVIRWGKAEARDPQRLAARINAGFARALERGRGRAM
jgi:hypothetical protein